MSSSDDDDCYTNTANVLAKAYNTAKSNVRMQDLLAGLDSPEPSKSPKKRSKPPKKTSKSKKGTVFVIPDMEDSDVSISKDVVEVIDLELYKNNDSINSDCEIVSLSDSQNDISSVLAKIDACMEASKPKRQKGRKQSKTPAKKRKTSAPRQAATRGRRRRNVLLYPDEVDPNLPPLFTKSASKVKSAAKNASSSPNEDEINPIIMVKVWWRLQDIDKFEIRRFQKLDSIFEHYAKQENVTEDRLMFTLKDKVIKKDDSPDSLSLEVSSVIEGGILTNSLENHSSMRKKSHQLEFKIQRKDSKKPIVIGINKCDTMGNLLAKVGEELKLPLNGFKLFFDGDVISPTDKPEDLELEGGECLDLKIM